jgi:hypothetical protein
MLSFVPKLRLYWGEIVCTGSDLVLGGKTKTGAWFPSPGVSEVASVGTAMMGNGVVNTCPLNSVLKNLPKPTQVSTFAAHTSFANIAVHLAIAVTP